MLDCCWSAESKKPLDWNRFDPLGLPNWAPGPPPSAWPQIRRDRWRQRRGNFQSGVEDKETEKTGTWNPQKLASSTFTWV